METSSTEPVNPFPTRRELRERERKAQSAPVTAQKELVEQEPAEQELSPQRDDEGYNRLIPDKSVLKLETDLQSLTTWEMHEVVNYYDECIGTIWHYLVKLVPVLLGLALISMLFVPLGVSYGIAGLGLILFGTGLVLTALLNHRKKPYDDMRTEMVSEDMKVILSATQRTRSQR